MKLLWLKGQYDRKAWRKWHDDCFFQGLMNIIDDVGNQTESSLAKGIMGAVFGALVGVGAMFGFYTLAGFRFPLLGVGIGILTGYSARLMFKGGNSTLGYVSGGVALAAVVATLFLMYGTFPLMSIISVVVSVSFAYRIASK